MNFLLSSRSRLWPRYRRSCRAPRLPPQERSHTAILRRNGQTARASLRYLTRQVRIELPPVHSDLLSFIDRANQQPDTDRQKLDVGQRYPDISGDHQTLVQDPIQNVYKVCGAGYCGCSFHPSSLSITSTLKTRTAHCTENTTIQPRLQTLQTQKKSTELSQDGCGGSIRGECLTISVNLIVRCGLAGTELLLLLKNFPVLGGFPLIPLPSGPQWQCSCLVEHFPGCTVRFAC